MHSSTASWLFALLATSAQLAFASSPAPKSRVAALPFINDDYRRALAQAKTHHVPIFVEAWAPW
jgi:hypothetical protein